MKPLFGFLFLALSTSQVAAQFIRPIEESRRHIVKINPFSAFLSTVNVHYEINHNKDASSMIQLFYFGGVFFGQQTDFNGAGLTYNYRFYLTESYPAGWYVQPYGRYQIYWPATIPTDDRLNVFGAGIVFGRQFVFARHFVIDCFLGPSYNESAINGVRLRSANFIPMLKGPWFRSGIAVGFIF